MPINSNVFSHDFSKSSGREIYRLLVAAVVPRPIAFVSTIGNSGVINLAPFSFFNAVSSDPPCLVFSITRKPDGEKKDTLRNIEENGEFVVNSTEESFAAQVNAASVSFPYGVSELEEVGLHSVPSLWVKPPRVLESAIQMECRLEKIVEIGEGNLGSSSLVIGRIVGMHVAERVLTQGSIDYSKLKPVARLGHHHWLRGGEIFNLPRP